MDLSLLRTEVRSLAQAVAEFSQDVTECRRDLDALVDRIADEPKAREDRREQND